MQNVRRNTFYVLGEEVIIRHDLNFKIEHDDQITLDNLQRWSAITVLKRLGSNKVQIRTLVTNCKVEGSGGSIDNLSRNRLHHRLSQRAADRAELRLMQVIDVVVDLTFLLPFLMVYFYAMDGDVDILQTFLNVIAVKVGLESLRLE